MLRTPKKGELEVEAKELDARFVVACAYHRGEEVIATETRVDPDTEKPRQRRVYNEAEATWEWIDVDFPVYSETEITSPGFEPDCPACQRALFEARQHASAVQQSADQADYEFEQELRRRGMT